MKEKLKSMSLRPVEEHFHDVLSKYEIGRKSSLFAHLNYRYSLLAASSLADHTYCKGMHLAFSNILPDASKCRKIEENINRVLNYHNRNTTTLQSAAIVTDDTIVNISSSCDLQPSMNTIFNDINSQIQSNVTEIKMDLHNVKVVPPNVPNYVSLIQNTHEWNDLRRHKITASRLPALIGMYGKNKFDIYWQIVQQGLLESDILNNNFTNFKRGHYYENEARIFFATASSSEPISCGFFIHPTDNLYGASPDGLVGPGMLLEIKTRSANSEAPLVDINKCPGYFIQCQQQMVCTDSQYCILMSYHPETKSATYFIIQRNNLIWSVIKTLMDSIAKQEPLIEWPFKENKALINLEKNTFHRIPTFEAMKPLRTYINKLVKEVPSLTFM